MRGQQDFIQAKWDSNAGCRMWQNDDMPFRTSSGRAAVFQCGAWYLKPENSETHGFSWNHRLIT
jgi:hypothetical protein